MDTTALSREEIIKHLDTPVCEIMSGVRTHVQTINLLTAWKLCYALHCDSPEKLTAVMWSMIKKRKRKDSTWQNCLPGPKDGSSSSTKRGQALTKSGKRSKRTPQKSQKPAFAS